MTATSLFLFTAIAFAALSPGLDARALQEQAPPPVAPLATPRSEPRSDRVARLEGERRELLAEVAALRSQPVGQAGTAAFEARIAELERRIRELESELAKLRADALRSLPGTQTPADPTGLQPADPFGQGGQVTAGNAFNPSISVIPDGVYYNDDRGGGATDIIGGAAGFDTHAAETGGHGHGSVERGFNLRELEVSFSGSVDPYFDAWAVLAVSGAEIEAEEAFVQTRQFIPGLQVKFGKFFSGIGYMNRQHPHQWDFVDQALPYELLFGGALNEVGVQVNWLPSLPIYTLMGFEALQGENEGVAQHLGPDTAASFADRAGPRLFTGFVKVSPDVGYSGALQFGASLGHSRLHQEQHDGDAEPEALEGTTTFFGLDAVYRYDSGKQWGAGD
ncbi:MAG: flagellar protein FliT, partial [Acidobacteria bacterium]